MPLIMALVLALSAAILNVRMTQATQILLDRIEMYSYIDQGYRNAHNQLYKGLEALASSPPQLVFKVMRENGWQIEESGHFFNPLLWVGWSEEQRERFMRGFESTSIGKIWSDRLDVFKQCLPEKSIERKTAFNRCTELPLLEGMALFPEASALDLNQAPISLLRLMLPEATAMHWTTLERERQTVPFSSMNDFSNRVPQITDISPLTGGLDIQSRYLWLRWKSGDTKMLWLIDRQTTEASSPIIFSREG